MKHHISAIALISLTASLFAQEAEVQTLPTTVITGELWESDIQKTTASVTVFDEATLENSGVQHFEDVINAIPNLTWTGGTSRPRYIQIRGIGENSQFEGETPDSSVRFLIDDLDLTGLGSVGNLFDVQQVEVLRGPQAGAFGANAAGGVVKITTNEPTPYWTGQVESTIGTDSLFSGGIAIGGPILENDPEQLTFRLSIHQLVEDGFRDNEYLNEDDTNERDEFTTRLKVRWIANEDWQWDSSLFYANADNGYDEWTLDNTEFDTYSDDPGRDEQESIATSLRGTWTGLEKVKVSTITSISSTNSTYSFDGDWSNEDEVADGYSAFVWLDRERTRWSEELRFDSLDKEDALGWIDRWTAGLYFEDFSESSEFGGDWGGFHTDYNSQTFSIYAQGTHYFNDSTRLILGLRAEYYDLQTDIEGSREGVDYDDLLLGGKITLEHDLNEAHMLFTSLARGYKAGGANIYPYLPSNTGLDDYETETLWNYEIGLRSSWFDDRVSTKITAFYLYRQDPQLRDSEGSGVDYSYLTVNGDTAIHYGLEGEVTWYLNKQFTASANLGLLNTERESYDDNGTEVSSRELANAPAYTYSARLDYQADNGFFANIEVNGSDAYYESNSHNEKRSEFAVFNAAIGYRYENWTLTVWGKNIFDREYEKRVFYFANDTPDYTDVKRFEDLANPQQFGATLNYSW
jgi:outer membrane receptor protein involved in Fe transport